MRRRLGKCAAAGKMRRRPERQFSSTRTIQTKFAPYHTQTPASIAPGGSAAHAPPNNLIARPRAFRTGATPPAAPPYKARRKLLLMPRTESISSRTNPRVKRLRAALNGNARLAAGLIAIEGHNLIAEALRSGIPLETLFLTEGVPEPPNLPAACEVVRLTQDVFASVSATEAPQGVAALLEPPELELRHGPTPLLLIAGGLQDPGNLGTLIRSAEAFGAEAVLLTPGTVSPWNPKTLRASTGSIFRVPVLHVTHARLAALRTGGIRILAAVTGDSAPHYSASVPITQLDLTTPCAFLIGNEGAGLSADLLALAETRITIPTPGPVESLNASVAGSLLLYEAARQREASHQRETADSRQIPDRL